MSSVLIVDDDLSQLELFSEAFRLKNFEVITAESCEECLTKARDRKPDLILMDIVMPGVGGLDALKKIRFDKELKLVKVVLMTNLSRPGLEAEAISAGADGFMLKAEYTPREMVQKVASLIK